MLQNNGMVYFGTCYYNALKEQEMPPGYLLSASDRMSLSSSLVGVYVTRVRKLRRVLNASGGVAGSCLGAPLCRLNAPAPT